MPGCPLASGFGQAHKSKRVNEDKREFWLRGPPLLPVSISLCCCLCLLQLELMKLATQDQLVHAAEVVSKYHDGPTIAPVGLPLPQGVTTTDVKPVSLRPDNQEPVVVRKDSIPLEDAISENAVCCFAHAIVITV